MVSKGLRDYLAMLFMIVLSGGLLTLSFPPIGLYGLVWVSLVPFFQLLHGETSYRKGFIIGFLMGFVHVSTTMYWISVSVYKYGGIPMWGTAIITFSFIFYLCLYWGLTGFIFVFLKEIRILWLFPFLAAVIEYIRGYPLLHFPWGGVEMALPPHLAISQIVDITGIYGLGFLIYVVNLIVYRLWCHFREKRISSAVREAVLSVLLISIAWIYGAVKIHEVQREASHWKKVKVCLVQPDIDQSVKWKKSWEVKGLDLYVKMSKMGAGEFRTNMVVWPEAAVTFYINEEPGLFRRVLQMVRRDHFMLIFGATSYEKKNDKTIYHNSAYLISKEGEIEDRYDKVRLVPFGEYVPFRRWLPFAKNIVGTEEDFTPGKRLKPLKSEFGPIGTTICFEGIFPEISRKLVRMGSVFLVNMTNDAWFGRTSGPYQHLRLSAYRAVENRVYLVRSTGTGISAIVDPVGKILARIPLGVRGFARGIVRLREGRNTFYTRHGDIFVIFCAVFALVVLTGAIFIHRKGEGEMDDRETPI